MRSQPTPRAHFVPNSGGGSSTCPCPCPSSSRALALPSLIPLPHPSERPTRKLSCCFKASIIQRFLKWIIISVRRRASRGEEEKGEEDEEADDGDADDDLCEKKSCKGFYLTDPGKEGERQLQMPQLKRAAPDCRHWTCIVGNTGVESNDPSLLVHRYRLLMQEATQARGLNS